MLRSRLAHQEAFQEQDARKTHCKDRNQVSNIKTVYAILILRAFIFSGQCCESRENDPSYERVGPRLSGLTVRMRGFGFPDMKQNCNLFAHETIKSSFFWRSRLNEFVLSRSNWSLKCWLFRKGENLSTRRKTSGSKGENQQQTQPTYGIDTGIWTQAVIETFRF